MLTPLCQGPKDAMKKIGINQDMKLSVRLVYVHQASGLKLGGIYSPEDCYYKVVYHSSTLEDSFTHAAVFLCHKVALRN